MFALVVSALSALLPWSLRRVLLEKLLGFQLHPLSSIGLSLLGCRRLVMAEGSRIGSLNVIKGVDSVELSEFASIGNLNWITGFPLGTGSAHFAHQPERYPELRMERHSGISNRHLIDCTASVSIGAYATFAGFRSQILTHSIDLRLSRQAAQPVSIGEYSFVGTDCVLLGGSTLPPRSVLGAKSLLNKSYSEPYRLYAGVPARPIKELPQDWAYFARQHGFVE